MFLKYLSVAWRKWLKIARIIGNFQLRIIFSLFYLLLFSIIGIIFRFFTDPLQLKGHPANKKTAFVPWEHPTESLTQAHKPF